MGFLYRGKNRNKIDNYICWYKIVKKKESTVILRTKRNYTVPAANWFKKRTSFS